MCIRDSDRRTIAVAPFRRLPPHAHRTRRDAPRWPRAVHHGQEHAPVEPHSRLPGPSRGLARGRPVRGVLALFFFFFNHTATTEIYTRKIVGSVRCV